MQSERIHSSHEQEQEQEQPVPRWPASALVGPLAQPARTLVGPAAVLQLQRTAGNRAVAATLARADAAPPAAADPTLDQALLAFCDGLWKATTTDPLSMIRLVLEPTRLIPVPGVGLVGGAAADLITAGQDLMAIPIGNIAHNELNGLKLGYGGLVGLTVGVRSIVNTLNNAVGHLEAWPDLAVALGLSATVGEAATGVGAPAAVVTGAATGVVAAVAEALGFIKISLTSGTALCDFVVTLEAGAGVLMFPEDAEKWWSLGYGYLANLCGDALGALNDAVGLATAGGSQPGAVSQAIATLVGLAKTLGKVFVFFSAPLAGIWNVIGGKAIELMPSIELPAREPEGLTPETRSPADAPPAVELPLGRRAIEGAADPNAGWFSARAIELDAMRDAFGRGDPMVQALGAQMDAIIGVATLKGQLAAENLPAVEELHANIGGLLADFEERFALVGSVEAQAAPALAQLTLVEEQLAQAIEAVDALTPDLGEGMVLDTIEAALDTAKQAVLVPLRELRDAFDGMRQMIEALVQSARIVQPHLQEGIASLREIVESSEDVPALLQELADQCLAFSSTGEIDSFADLFARWEQLGPELDAAAEAVAARMP